MSLTSSFPIPTMKLSTKTSSLMACFSKLSISPNCALTHKLSISSSIFQRTQPQNKCLPTRRAFSTTPTACGNWLLPTEPEKKRSRKGRPRVPTGGSSRGTTIVWGDYGLRMSDHHRRISASQLKIGEEAIKVRLRGMRYRLYKRVCANIGVYTSGNEVNLYNV